MCSRKLSFGELRLGKSLLSESCGTSGGFSLIEMLVAMAIFMVFTGILISSYIGIVKALQGAEEYRVLYADARHVFDVITETARNSTIYPKENFPCNNDDPNSFKGEELRRKLAESPFTNPLTSLEFCSKDGLTKTVFKYEEGTGRNAVKGIVGESELMSRGMGDKEIGSTGKLIMEKLSRTSVNSPFGSPEETKLYSDSIRITGFNFYVWPLKDPFAVSSYGDSKDLSNLFQPKVTFAATFERDNSKGGTYSIDLQTSVSLRVYN